MSEAGLKTTDSKSVQLRHLIDQVASQTGDDATVLKLGEATQKYAKPCVLLASHCLPLSQLDISQAVLC